MKQPTESYLKVPYDLRPAKQVERRMFVETFQVLSSHGFPISEYQYTGLGSVYFVDFVLFHKLLGIHRMLSVECSQKIRKRVRFNRPFRCVEVRLGKIADSIPKLSRDREHILWLDYDNSLTREQLEDLWLAAAHLPRRSIILVTVDVEGPVTGGPKQWRDYFRAEANEYLGTSHSLADFAESNLWKINRDILVRTLASGMSSREVDYIPMFCFLYADGHNMLTIGGMLGNKEDKDKVCSTPLKDLRYIKFDPAAEPYRIRVPHLTRKERFHLDQRMPFSMGWKLHEFELPDEFVQAYQELYRFLPSYAELFL